MMVLKNGRYEQKTPWSETTPNGKVAKFWDTNTRKEVFIKEFPKKRYVKDEDLRDRDGRILQPLVDANKRVDAFCQKMRLINEKVNHIAAANGDVVITTDFFREGVSNYKVSELIKLEKWAGSEVKDHLSMEQIDTLMQRLSMALVTLHNANVLHCDLKPDNIFIVKDPDGEYVGMLSDFDDSFLMDAIPGGYDVVCTPEYASPELGYHKDCEEDEPAIPLYEASDVFALGLIYHEYLTGEFPKFDENEYSQLYAALLQGEPLKVSPKLTPAHRLLMCRMLTTLPYDRLQNCSEVVEEIKMIRRRYPAEFCLTLMNGRQPLANQKVSLWAHYKSSGKDAERQSVCLSMGKTDAQGQMVIKGLTDCEYTVQIDDAEFPVVWQNPERYKYTCNIQLKKVEKYTVKVTMDGKPLSGKGLTLTRLNDKLVKQAELKGTTNAHGQAEFEDLPEGIYQITVDKVSKRFRWDSSRQYAFNIDTYVLQLMNGAQPAANTALQLVMATDKGRKTIPVKSNGSGQLKMPNLNMKAKYSIISNGVEIPVNWGADRKATVQLKTQTVMLFGVRMADTKQPVEGVKVCIGKNVGGKFVKLSEGMTNAHGAVKLGSFEEGEYYLAILRMPAGVKLIKQQVGKPVRIKLEGETKKVVIGAAKDTESILLDQDIPQNVSVLYSHIVKFKDGRVVLTRRHDGSKETTTANQLSLRDLDMYR